VKTLPKHINMLLVRTKYLLLSCTMNEKTNHLANEKPPTRTRSIVVRWMVYLVSIIIIYGSWTTPAFMPTHIAMNANDEMLTVRTMMFFISLAYLVWPVLIFDDSALTPALMFFSSACFLLAPIAIVFTRRRVNVAEWTPPLAWCSWGLLLIWIPPIYDLVLHSKNQYGSGYCLVGIAYTFAFVAVDRRKIKRPRASRGQGGFPIFPLEGDPGKEG